MSGGGSRRAICGAVGSGSGAEGEHSRFMSPPSPCAEGAAGQGAAGQGAAGRASKRGASGRFRGGRGEAAEAAEAERRVSRELVRDSALGAAKGVVRLPVGAPRLRRSVDDDTEPSEEEDAVKLEEPPEKRKRKIVASGRGMSVVERIVGVRSWGSSRRLKV